MARAWKGDVRRWLGISLSAAILVAGLPAADADFLVNHALGLPEPRTSSAAFFDGEANYLVAGYSFGHRTDILRQDLETGTFTRLSAHLPSARSEMAAVWVDGAAYVLGGMTGLHSPPYLDEIVKFVPETGEVSVMAARLPSPRAEAAAVWTGRYVFVFGGEVEGVVDKSDEIVRYDPELDAVQIMQARLPSGRKDMAVVWTGQHAYLFGGDGCPKMCDEIIRYDPETDEVLRLDARLPAPRMRMPAIWSGDAAYLFGGLEQISTGTRGIRDTILRFDPAVSSITLANARLPGPTSAVAATWDGSVAHIFGRGETSAVVRYDPTADTIHVVGLVKSMTSQGAAWDGNAAYLFGTWDEGGPGVEIFRYNTTDLAPQLLSARLPAPMSDFATVWVGDSVLLIGGERLVHPHTTLSTLQRFDPATESLTVLPGAISARRAASAVWTGREVLVFGGDEAPASSRDAYTDEILRINPVTGATVVANARLPTPRAFTSAAWDGTYAYIFGGLRGSVIGEILRYDPASDTILTLSATLPAGKERTTAVSTGRFVYLFGGSDGTTHRQEIVRFDTSTYALAVMEARLPAPRVGLAAVWTGSEALLFGGMDVGGGPSLDILKYRLPPGAPTGLTATRGHGAGEIRLTWAPPNADSLHGPVKAYRVYAGAASNESHLISEVSTTSYVHSGLPAGARRYYRVTTVTDTGESEPTPPIGARAPDVPGHPSSISQPYVPRLGSTRVSWTPPLDDGGLPIEGYAVYRAVAGDLHRPLAVVTGVSWFDDIPPTNGIYEYRVTAMNAVGEGPFSAVETVSMAPHPATLDADVVLADPSSLAPDAPDVPQFEFYAEGVRANGTVLVPTVAGNYTFEVLSTTFLGEKIEADVLISTLPGASTKVGGRALVGVGFDEIAVGLMLDHAPASVLRVGLELQRSARGTAGASAVTDATCAINEMQVRAEAEVLRGGVRVVGVNVSQGAPAFSRSSGFALDMPLVSPLVQGEDRLPIDVSMRGLCVRDLRVNVTAPPSTFAGIAGRSDDVRFDVEGAPTEIDVRFQNRTSPSHPFGGSRLELHQRGATLNATVRIGTSQRIEITEVPAQIYVDIRRQPYENDTTACSDGSDLRRLEIGISKAAPRGTAIRYVAELDHARMDFDLRGISSGTFLLDDDREDLVADLASSAHLGGDVNGRVYCRNAKDRDFVIDGDRFLHARLALLSDGETIVIESRLLQGGMFRLEGQRPWDWAWFPPLTLYTFAIFREAYFGVGIYRAFVGYAGIFSKERRMIADETFETEVMGRRIRIKSEAHAS